MAVVGENLGNVGPLTDESLARAERALRTRGIAGSGVVVPPSAAHLAARRSRRYALGAGVVVAVIAYAFTGRAVLSAIVGGVSGTAVGLAHRSRVGGLRESLASFANLRHGILPGVMAENCVDAAKRSAQARGLDLATLPTVPPVTCTTENGKSICRSADGVVQATDCLPEPGSAFLAFALAVERALTLAGLQRAGNGALPADPVQSIQSGPLTMAAAEVRGAPQPLVFGTRTGGR